MSCSGTGTATPTGPRGAPGQDGTATVVASVVALRANLTLTGSTSLVLNSYYGDGEGGGGLLVLDPTHGADDGGQTFRDASGQSWTRLNPTGDVREWGARCDAVFVTSGAAGMQGNTFFTVSPALPLSAAGKPIALVGAGVAGAVLFTTIVSVVGNTVNIAVPIATSFPLFVAGDFGVISPSTMNGQYVYGDAYLMSDGTTVIVNAVSGGNVTSVTPSVQAAPQLSLPGILSQVSATNSGGGGNSGGAGLGLQLTLRYTATGQFVYGTDDSAAIQAALIAAPTVGFDVLIPGGGVCGTTVQINLPPGSVYLRGIEMWGTGIVALAPMTRVLYRPGGGSGGGASRLFVDAMKGAASAIEIAGGREVNWEYVQARNGITYDWFGSGTTTGQFLTFCDARQITSMFGNASDLSSYNYFWTSAASTRMIGCVGDACSQASVRCPGPGLYATLNDMFGGSCYAYDPAYGFDVNGSQQSLFANQVGSPRIAAYHIAGSGVSCQDNISQWGLAGYCDQVNAYGVLIESTGGPFFTNNCIIMGNTDDGSLPAANKVAQLGTASSTTLVTNNPGATYSTQATAVGRSYFENGAMLVWQEQTNYTFVAAGQKFLADRWKGYLTATGNISVSQVPGVSGSLYAMKIQRALSDTHTAQFRFGQQIETGIAGQLAGKQVVVSFDIEVGADYSGGSFGPDLFIYTGSSATPDEPFNMATQSFPSNPVASGNIRNALLPVGSAVIRSYSKIYVIPAGTTEIFVSWRNTYAATAGANDWITVSNLKIEAGSAATPFEQQFPATTYVECERFYQETFLQATAPAQGVGIGTGEWCEPASHAGAVSNLLGTFRFGVLMRVPPTIVSYNPASANAQVRDETAGADCSAIVVDSVTQNGCRISCTGASATAVGNVLGVHLTADARL